MIAEKQALELIKKLTEQVAKEATPLWAWHAAHDVACHALGLSEVTKEGIDWALKTATELGLDTEKAQDFFVPQKGKMNVEQA